MKEDVTRTRADDLFELYEQAAVEDDGPQDLGERSWLDFGDDGTQGIDLDDMSLEQVFDRFTIDPRTRYAYIPVALWRQIAAKYRQCEIKRAFARHVIKHKAVFPLNPPGKDRAEKRFRGLLALDTAEMMFPPDPARPFQGRVPYPSWTPDNTLGVIRSDSTYNAASNHYQWGNRMQCGGWRDPSPREAWSTESNLYTLRLTWWSLDKKEGPSCAKTWRTAFLLSATGIYMASQFRPYVAKAMYGWAGAETVLDPSCGWGDRLAGFYATPTTRTYVGCDPNTAVFDDYLRQCQDYDRWFQWGTGATKEARVERMKIDGYRAFRFTGAKDVLIVNGPFEDIAWGHVQKKMAPKGFDLAFTSPPYFGVEQYAKGTPSVEAQSWVRYPVFDRWRDLFLFPMLRTIGGILRPEGIMAINIADPIIKDTRNEACEPMIRVAADSGMNYLGVIPMPMSRRPSSAVKGMGAIPPDRFAEPIWVFRKGGGGVPALPKSQGDPGWGVIEGLWGRP